MSPSPRDLEIIRLRYEGNSRDDIVKLSGHGGGTVNKVTSEFIAMGERIGLYEAADQYGVRETLEGLHSLSRDLKRERMTVADSSHGLTVAVELRKLDAQDDVSGFVRKVQRQESKYPLPDMIKYAEKLYDLEAETGKMYPQIISEFKEKSEKTKTLDQENSDLRKKKRESDADLQKTLQENEVTHSELTEYVGARKGLKELGLGVTVDKLPALGRVLKTAEELGYVHEPKDRGLFLQAQDPGG